MAAVVIANGFPKTGTHALKKAIELLGLTRVQHMHQPHHRATGGKPFKFDGRMVIVYRHPRNVLVSTCRALGNATASGNLIGLIRDHRSPFSPSDVGSMARAYRAYLPWRDDKRCLVVRYEDLVSSDASLRRMAGYLGVPFLDDAFANLPGLSPTWSGAPSRWQDHWSEAVEAVWIEAGMQALQEELGYAE